jgi:hypothetical protein
VAVGFCILMTRGVRGNHLPTVGGNAKAAAPWRRSPWPPA